MNKYHNKRGRFSTRLGAAIISGAGVSSGTRNGALHVSHLDLAKFGVVSQYRADRFLPRDGSKAGKKIRH